MPDEQIGIVHHLQDLIDRKIQRLSMVAIIMGSNVLIVSVSVEFVPLHLHNWSTPAES
jgi:hypothetical protein